MPWSRGDVADLKADYTRDQLVAARKVISQHRLQPLQVVNQALADVNFGYQVTSAKELSATLDAIRGAIALHDSENPRHANEAHFFNRSTREIE